MTNRLSRTFIEDRSIPVPNSGCWIWLGHLRNGYGAFSLNNKTVYAHRKSFEIYTGQKAPEGKDICHSCDVRSCVNPDHLFLGTRSDNMRDCSRKGRLVVPVARGEDLTFSTLTENDVRTIRRSTASSRHLAKEYGVDHKTILAVVNRKTWVHV
jgi:hypothetical protein